MTILPLSTTRLNSFAAAQTAFIGLLKTKKGDVPYFASLGRDSMSVGKGGGDIEIINAKVIAGALKERFGGERFTFSNLHDMLEMAGWQDDDIQSPDGVLGVINKLQNEFGLDKTFSFEEAGNLFADRFATEFKGKGMTKTEALVWGVAK